jgi:DDE superfamily endonuclease
VVQAAQTPQRLWLPARSRLETTSFRFKHRYDLKSYRLHREAASAPLEDLLEERKRLAEIILPYDLEDVYNANETGLFFRMLPSQTLASSSRSGMKKDKERITIFLAANATGTHKLKPLIIGKSAQPRAFGKTKMSTLPYITYRSNSKAWMTTAIFEPWIIALNAYFRIKNRKVLLLIDNAPSHSWDKSLSLENVRVEFLPPNTTAHLQPMDAGIISNFKAKY